MTFWIWKHVTLIKDSVIFVNKNVWSSDGNLLVLTSNLNKTTFFCNNFA